MLNFQCRRRNSGALGILSGTLLLRIRLRWCSERRSCGVVSRRRKPRTWTAARVSLTRPPQPPTASAHLETPPGRRRAFLPLRETHAVNSMVFDFGTTNTVATIINAKGKLRRCTTSTRTPTLTPSARSVLLADLRCIMTPRAPTPRRGPGRSISFELAGDCRFIHRSRLSPQARSLRTLRSIRAGTSSRTCCRSSHGGARSYWRGVSEARCSRAASALVAGAAPDEGAGAHTL